MAKITINGMLYYENNLFANLELPEGIDKETVIENIILKGGDFEVIYPATGFFKEAIGTWSRKWSRTFEKWYAALNIDYNPLENYDRREESSENGRSTDESHGDTSGTNSVSAYNASSFQNRDASTGHSDTNGITTLENNRESRIHGNIGVTTSQQMLQSELELAKWNLYDHIADIFLSEFVIPIY